MRIERISTKIASFWQFCKRMSIWISVKLRTQKKEVKKGYRLKKEDLKENFLKRKRLMKDVN